MTGRINSRVALLAGALVLMPFTGCNEPNSVVEGDSGAGTQDEVAVPDGMTRQDGMSPQGGMSGQDGMSERDAVSEQGGVSGQDGIALQDGVAQQDEDGLADGVQLVDRVDVVTHVAAEALYERNCSQCHGGRGNGNLGPGLAGNHNLASSSYVVARIQLGGGGMPPFARLLSAGEIAGVAEFIRNAWENGYGPVSEEQVDLQWNGLRRGMHYGTYNLPETQPD